MGAPTTTPGESLLGSLHAIAPELAKQDAPGVAATLAPYLEGLGGALDPAQARTAVDAVSAVCRALHAHARSAEALPLARELLAQCARVQDDDQTRRAAGVCGLLAADSADLVGAIEYHVRALRLAAGQEDRSEMARAWSNIGHAFGVAGRYEMAVRCFDRCLALVAPMENASHIRFPAMTNLAEVHYHLGQIVQGLAHGEGALRELAMLPSAETYAVILLRRTLVRLYIATGRTAEAEQQVARTIALAGAAPSNRVSIVVDVTRATYEMATGNADFALTRLDRALDRAREVPATLHETLACAVRAEEAAGNPARALMRLGELSNHLYGSAIERARAIVDVPGMDASEAVAEHVREQTRARLQEQLDPPAAPQSWGALRRLAAGAALRMDDSASHGARVGVLVKGLALAWGSSPLEAQELGFAAELHDIGMASVPHAILGKPGALNDAERAAVRKHPEAGAAMLVDDRHPRVLLARDIARFHHARWDGAGYPPRVSGHSIPLGARMCAIADAYDMMVCGYGGHGPLSMGAALEELERESGAQFDPGLVSCFLVLIRDELLDRGADAPTEGMEAFHDLVAALRENRGFV